MAVTAVIAVCLVWSQTWKNCCKSACSLATVHLSPNLHGLPRNRHAAGAAAPGGMWRTSRVLLSVLSDHPHAGEWVCSCHSLSCSGCAQGSNTAWLRTTEVNRGSNRYSQLGCCQIKKKNYEGVPSLKLCDAQYSSSLIGPWL